MKKVNVAQGLTNKDRAMILFFLKQPPDNIGAQLKRISTWVPVSVFVISNLFLFQPDIGDRMLISPIRSFLVLLLGIAAGVFFARAWFIYVTARSA